MPTPTHRRIPIAFVTAASLLLAQACFAYQRPKVGIVGEPGARVRVHSTRPFTVRAEPNSDPRATPPDCRASLVEGRLTSATADAISLHPLTRVVVAGPAGSCTGIDRAVAVIPVAGAEVSVHRFSGRRTVILLVAIAAAAAAFVAFAVSQIEYDLSGDECGFCF